MRCDEIHKEWCPSQDDHNTKRHRRNAVVTDVFGGVFKASVYGVLIALSGCLRGLQCGNSLSAVIKLEL